MVAGTSSDGNGLEVRGGTDDGKRISSASNSDPRDRIVEITEGGRPMSNSGSPINDNCGMLVSDGMSGILPYNLERCVDKLAAQLLGSSRGSP